MFRFPVSALLAGAFVLLVYVIHRYAGRSALVRFLSGRGSAIVSLSVLSALVLFEALWPGSVVGGVVFAVVALLFLICLGLSLLSGVKAKRSGAFILSHVGIFIIVLASFFGSLDAERLSMALSEGSDPLGYAFDSRGVSSRLPMSVELKSFKIEYYKGSDSPKQYSSELILDGKVFETGVNHPISYKGYFFYQQGFSGDTSIIGVSRDPWLPMVYLGMLLLAAGSVLFMAGRWKLKVIIPVSLIVAGVFTVISLARISLSALQPALRSIWFVPHLLVYMLAYSLMAVSLVLSVVGFFSKRCERADVVDKLVRVSSSLLIIGMLCGAVWAQQAWGDYWSWDPKECLAAMTWLLTLIYLHISSSKRRTLLLVLLLAFVALQFTWYGVNYLPSAQESLHTYNSVQR